MFGAALLQGRGYHGRCLQTALLLQWSLRLSLLTQTSGVLSTQGAKEWRLTDLLRAEKEEMWQSLLEPGFRGSFCFVFLSGVS